jgi:cytoskeletal protein CcmA (bactofilin family)
MADKDYDLLGAVALFRRNRGRTAEAAAPPPLARVPARPPGSLSPLRGPPPILREMPLRSAEPPSAPAKPAEGRRLVIGREISLTGEIASCERLIVEGRVDGALTQCRDLSIVKGGSFKGVATVEEAEIRGSFEGTLNAKKRLVIRAGGSVVGTVRYGAIEIERGGRIEGDVQLKPAEETRDAPRPPDGDIGRA